MNLLGDPDLIAPDERGASRECGNCEGSGHYQSWNDANTRTVEVLCRCSASAGLAICGFCGEAYEAKEKVAHDLLHF